MSMYCETQGHNESEYILKEGVEIREAYVGKEKGAQVKKYNLGEMSQEQQERMRQILQKPEHEFIGQEIRRMEEARLIHPSNSPWASPVMLVKKKNDSYPLFRINELLDALKGSVWYTTLDLVSGFWQQLMDCVFQKEIWDFMLPYIDNVNIYSSDFNKHLEYMTIVLDQLRQADLRLNPNKCFFRQTKISFLGHEILGLGIMVAEFKVAAYIMTLQEYDFVVKSKPERQLGNVDGLSHMDQKRMGHRTQVVENMSDEHYDALLLARALRVVDNLFKAQIKAHESIQKSQQEQKWCMISNTRYKVLK
ncbi:30661_t:CDS:2 [Gigaspora margarita]|uniref:30661_t:CDS:1 n=1 Tax=Gigaspora margarita TaxID=4874 RepID=A0ABM8W164_GIGMA|nr:30661_t:CDS:2 [Gigaspora margarita]